MVSAFKKGLIKTEEDKKSLRSILSYYFNISLDQISKTVKWKTQNITSIYNKHVIYQSKLNDVAFCHIICKEDDYSHVVVQNIVDNLREKFKPFIQKLGEIKKENEKGED